MMTKRISALILALFMICMMPISVMANENRTYELDLNVNGAHEVQAQPGDVLNVTVTLKRTDNSHDYKMYAMQDEIRYDPNFFEIVDGSALMMDGIKNTDIELIDGYRSFYINFLSLTGGENWKADTLIGSFQVKVLGEKGSSMLKNENGIISKQDGNGSFELTANDLLVVVSSECTVKFDSMGGSSVADQTVYFGEKINQPEDPTREGYTFDGWYKDIYLKNEWNFDNDVVTDNMTLYASWQKGSPMSSSDFPWIIMVVIFVAAMVIYWIYRKKRNQNRE